MLFYSAGVAMICSLFIVMHLHAYRRRADLELDSLECYLTRGSISAQVVSLAIAVVSILLAAIGGSAIPWSGLIYFLMGPAHFVNGYLWGRGAEKLYVEMGHQS